MGLVSMLAACALRPVAHVPEQAAARPSASRVQVADGGGAPKQVRPGTAARLIDPGGAEAMLKHHLVHVEDAIATPLVLGNDAHLLIDGPETKDAMFRAMGQARRQIDLETYILEAAGSGQRLVELIETKRAEGVRVRILYDSVGSMDTPAEYFQRLTALGATVCEFNPVNALKAKRDSRLTINNRDHRKLLIVDDKVAFTGGINISAVYSSGSFGRKHRAPDRTTGWRDTHVQVRGPVVAQFQELFEQSWRGQNCQAAELEPGHAGQRKPLAAAGKMAARLVAADPQMERSELYVALLSAIEHARERVWLTYGYFVPDEGTLSTLEQAARRGIDVRLALPGFSDFWAPFHAGRSHYARLLDAGVRIFERRDALLHAKTAVIDGVWSSVGSTNLDWRSFVHNYEADLLVLDRGFADEMEALFRLDESVSHEILEREWKRRDVGVRFLEWLARRWEYLL